MDTPTDDVTLAYLQGLRDDVLYKVEQLPEPDLRRPMTGTGTNLLGLVKHLAATEYGWFQLCFSRPVPPLPHLSAGADRLDDFFATEDETPEQVLQTYREATAASDATVAELGLDAVARVPWSGDAQWPMRKVIVHMAVETARHLGHMDVVREQLDGRAGLGRSVSMLPSQDGQFWADHVENLRRIWKLAEAGALPHQR